MAARALTVWATADGGSMREAGCAHAPGRGSAPARLISNRASAIALGRLALLEHRDDVSRGVLEPCDMRASLGAGDTLLVLLEAVETLEVNTARGKLVDCLLD